MSYSLRQLRYAVAVADCGSITNASEFLGISQPAISAAIRELEEEFALSLFARRPARRVALTSAGRRFIADARHLLENAQTFEDGARGLGTRLRGELSVGCFRPTAPFIMPLVYNAMRKAHPDVDLKIHEADLSETAALLQDGTIDVALTYDMHVERHMRFDPLISVRPYVLLAKSDPLAGKATVKLGDLAKKEMVILDLPVTHDFFYGLFYSHGLQPKIGYRTRSYEMVRSLVGTGDYFAILIMRPVTERAYDGSRLVCRPIADKIVSPNYGLAFHNQFRMTNLVDAFGKLCRRILKEEDLAKIFYVQQ